jgi:hypothetical protein
MNIIIAEAGPADGYPGSLRIYVGASWVKSKACGPGIKTAINAASLRNELSLRLIDEFVADKAFDTNGDFEVVLLYDPGQTTEAMALLDLVHKRHS